MSILTLAETAIKKMANFYQVQWSNELLANIAETGSQWTYFRLNLIRENLSLHNSNLMIKILAFYVFLKGERTFCQDHGIFHMPLRMDQSRNKKKF